MLNRSLRTRDVAAEIRTYLILVRKGVQDIEAECSTASENVVNPVTPALEVIGTTLVGDAAERATADFPAHRNRDVSDISGLWMDVSEFKVTASSIDWPVSHLCEGVH
jgi:putative N-acetylmannosamine-6-phosphate epimerase